jgi:hypothetical protein
MERAVEICQRERRGLEIVERTGPLFGGKGDGGDSRVGIDNGLAVERTGHSGEVDTLVDHQRRRVAYRDAHVVTAQSLGLELPPQRGVERVTVDEDAAVGDDGLHDTHLVAHHCDPYHHAPFRRSTIDRRAVRVKPGFLESPR